MNRIIERSNELTDYIIDNYEEKLIKKIIASDYGYFLPYEQEEIYKLSLKNKPECKGLISEKMKEYLENNDTVILDGFVNFRLKDYKILLTEIINKAVQEYEIQQEYDTFIGLLRYFVDMQIPLYDKIHLIGTADGTIEVFSDKNVKLTNETNSDLLLDFILTSAPNKIYIHKIENFTNEELINTIMNIFSGKITVCNGCGICGRIVQ